MGREQIKQRNGRVVVVLVGIAVIVALAPALELLSSNGTFWPSMPSAGSVSTQRAGTVITPAPVKTAELEKLATKPVPTETINQSIYLSGSAVDSNGGAGKDASVAGSRSSRVVEASAALDFIDFLTGGKFVRTRPPRRLQAKRKLKPQPQGPQPWMRKPFAEYVWKSPHPAWCWFNISDVRRCLTQARPVFLGDSHIRFIFHDIAFMLLFNHTYKLPSWDQLKKYPLPDSEFVRTDVFKGLSVNPCDYINRHTLLLPTHDRKRAGKQAVATFSFVAGACCMGLHGRPWMQNAVQDLPASTTTAVLYGGSVLWDAQAYNSTKMRADARCKKSTDTIFSYFDRAVSTGMAALHDFLASLPQQPTVLYRSGWASGWHSHQWPLWRDQNQIIQKHFPESHPLHFTTLVDAFEKTGEPCLRQAKNKKKCYEFPSTWAGDSTGHPRPEVARSLAMVFLNTICPNFCNS